MTSKFGTQCWLRMVKGVWLRCRRSGPAENAGGTGHHLLNPGEQARARNTATRMILQLAHMPAMQLNFTYVVAALAGSTLTRWSLELVIQSCLYAVQRHTHAISIMIFARKCGTFYTTMSIQAYYKARHHPANWTANSSSHRGVEKLRSICSNALYACRKLGMHQSQKQANAKLEC